MWIWGISGEKVRRLADVSVSLLVEEFFQFWCVHQVAIVRKADAVGAVHIERLGLSTCICRKQSVS